MSYTPNPAVNGVGEMSEYENAISLNITQTNTYNPIFTAGVVAGFLDGWTFVAGTGGAFTSVANAGGGQITFNTSGAHGMVAGQVVAITLSSVAGYRPPNPTIFVIQSVTATSFNVIASFTSTATGNYTRGTCIVAGPSAAGNYRLMWDATIAPANGNKDWKIEPLQNASNLDKAASEQIIATAGAACLAGGCFLTVAAGDKISLAINNQTDTTDIIIRNLNLNVLRYRAP
jgi:hypothetical protein